MRLKGHICGYVIRLEWNLGPWGGLQIYEGMVHDDEYCYKYDTITTDHFAIHGPKGHHGKLVNLSSRLEQAYGHIVEFVGESPPITLESNFYINPVGLWASYRGQELYLLGFHWWHPSDPASLEWEGGALHEIGHRIESELFGQSPNSFPLGGARNEVVASTICQHAISCLHGERFAWLHQKGEGERFFQNLEEPNNPPHPIWHNLFFIIQSYLPQRYDSRINHLFFRNWIETCVQLAPLAYTEEEIYAALYSKLAGENLCWLFQLCGFNIDEYRIEEAMQAIPAIVTKNVN